MSAQQVGARVTGDLAAFAVRTRYGTLPARVQEESVRAFLNWIGCVLGGSREPAVEIAAAVAAETGGVPKATLIGRGVKTDIVNAAFVNCLGSSVLAFDDTHLATVTHPTGPVAAALFAWSEGRVVSGEDFLAALALGIEIQCRLSCALLLPPARPNVALYITGITGPVGAAAALGRLMGLDAERMRWALGLAAAQASGLRATHGSMAGAFPPAHAARVGVLAALMAEKGFACSDGMIEAGKGFAEVFSDGADLGRAVDGLGTRFEMLANAYKPYPSGIVVQPVIDACLKAAESWPVGATMAAVRVTAHPLTLTLADRPRPTTFWEAQISAQHWAAVSLLHRSADIRAVRDGAIFDPAVGALRDRIAVAADPDLGREAATVELTGADGSVVRAEVAHARGSLARPMTDDELGAKFRAQATTALSDDAAARLLAACRAVVSMPDVGAGIVSALAG